MSLGKATAFSSSSQIQLHCSASGNLWDAPLADSSVCAVQALRSCRANKSRRKATLAIGILTTNGALGEPGRFPTTKIKTEDESYEVHVNLESDPWIQEISR
jgi:hypothetical protein